MVFEHYNHFSQTVDRLEEKVDQTADNILTRVDGVFKEVLAMRQEQVAHFGSHVRADETLENYEQRIKKLETKRAVV